MEWISKNRFFLAGLAIVLIKIAPYYVYGQNISITIHDNLDSNFVWMKVLLDGGYFTDWSKTTIDSIMNGVPVRSLVPVYNFAALIMGLFGVFWGYVAMKTLMAVTGYVGMWLLLRKFVIPSEPVWISAGVAMLYGLLPYWGFNLSIASLPLLVYAFLKIRRDGFHAGIGPWIILGAGGFASSLILVGVFLIGFLGVWVVYDWLFRKTKSQSAISGHRPPYLLLSYFKYPPADRFF